MGGLCLLMGRGWIQRILPLWFGELLFHEMLDPRVSLLSSFPVWSWAVEMPRQCTTHFMRCWTPAFPCSVHFLFGVGLWRCHANVQPTSCLSSFDPCLKNKHRLAGIRGHMQTSLVTYFMG